MSDLDNVFPRFTLHMPEWAATFERDQMFIHRKVWIGIADDWRALHPLVPNFSDHSRVAVLTKAGSGIFIVEADNP